MDRRHSAMVHSRFLLFFTCIPLMVSARFLFAFLLILCCPLLESGGVSRHILGHLALQAHREPHAPTYLIKISPSPWTWKIAASRFRHLFMRLKKFSWHSSAVTNAWYLFRIQAKA